MAKQTRTNLATRAGTIASEQTTGANTQIRVGSLLADIIDSVATEFDPARSYKPGEYIIWEDRNVRCFQTTTPGQSPATHPLKWDDKVIDSVEKLGPQGDNFPVLASALRAFVANAISQVGGTDTLQKADDEQLSDGIDDTRYVTSRGLKGITNALTDLLVDTISGASQTPGYLVTSGTTLLEFETTEFDPAEFA